VFRILLSLVTAVCLSSCHCGGDGGTDGGTGGSGGGTGGGGGTQPSGRCETDLTRFITQTTGTASAAPVTDASQLIGGPNAQGRVGDFILANERLRVVIQGPGRNFGPQPYGGTILDADLVRAGPGADQFGELGLLYNFGRTILPQTFEVLADGHDGAAAVLAVTGVDTANDYLSIRNKLAESLGRVPLADPFVAEPLLLTNYFIINPGESRVRFVTAFCNTSTSDTASLAVGDLVDPGYVLEYFNPLSCTNGFGYGGYCFGLDRMTWYGYQGDGVAYGYSPWKVGSPTQPEPQNAVLTVAGITGSIIGANGIPGLVSWINPASTPRDGELRLAPKTSGTILRDFWVAPTLGDIATLIEHSRAEVTGTSLAQVTATVTEGGATLADARVVFEGANGNSVSFTDATGAFSAALKPGTYSVSAWKAGRAPTTKQSVQLLASTPTSLSFTLTAPHTVHVTVREANGGPMPGKVTVLCPNGPCPVTARSLGLYSDAPKDPTPDNVQAVAYAGASGAVDVAVPPGSYRLLVSRGPEYSIYPNDFPKNPGLLIDVSQADTTVNAVLAHVIDTTGWMSADFHVHAVNSPDSIVNNDTRALTFAGDGVDVMVSTDHDFVTDYGPVISRLGLTPFLATVVGEEVSPMEFGHYNFFPLTRDDTALNGGAIDWAGADGPTLTVRDIFAAARAKGAHTVHFNHPRGTLGGFSYLKVDTDTLATHEDPLELGMARQADATDGDTRLVSADFNAMELLNPGEDDLDGTSNAARSRFNDWFTLLSRGFRVAGTGVSDTHYRTLGTGWRTWVAVGSDSTVHFDPLALSTALNAQAAVTSNAPFVTTTAYRVDASGTQVTASVPVGGLVPVDTRDLGVTVDVQVPEYLDVTKVELYLHRPEDDLSCPLDPAAPRAATTRVACGGTSNTNWPTSGIAASQTVTLTPGDLEVAAQESGMVFRRYHVKVHFRLPAPTTDNWVVAFVYGSKSLAPLLTPYPGLAGGVSPTAPFAFTNPIYIDADGNGFDHPPFAPPGGAHKPAPLPKPAPRVPPATEAELLERWGRWFHAH
jgi:hypothetical protein